MDFTIEHGPRSPLICPHTPRALARLSLWAHDGNHFPFPASALPSLIEVLVAQGFQVQDRRDATT